MKKQVKKLPAVWVGFDAKGLAWTTKSKPTAGDYKFVGEFHKYVPAKPAGICAWQWNATTEFWESGCEMATSRPPEKFCPYCGGKIKVSK